jgi:hypothetical protein
MNPKPQSDEYKAFENLLGKVLSVSKAELQSRLKAEKREKQTRAASHASGAPSIHT